MRVEVLYVADCPSHPATVELVRSVLAAEGLAPRIHEVLVKDERMARELRFCGSPTIRINGSDVATESPEPKQFALSCRIYQGARKTGIPPLELVRRAVVEACKRT